MKHQIQRTEGGWQRAEGGGQRSEGGGQRAGGNISVFQCFSVSAFAAMLLMSGCSKSSDLQPSTFNLQPSTPTPLNSNTVLRVHWAGKQTLGVAASAYSFMRLWNLPESKQVEAQLLGKLCNAPWQRAANEPPANNNASIALQPLLDDILNMETCLEIREVSSSQQMILAVRLNNARATQWTVNLADVLSSLEGTYPTKRGAGWFLNSPRSKTIYELERAGGWVVVGASKGTNGLFQEIVTRIGREQSPFTITATNHWLAADVDLGWVKSEVRGRKSEGGGEGKHRTSNIERSTSNAQLSTAPLTRPLASLSPSDEESDRGQKAEVGGRKSEGGAQRSESGKDGNFQLSTFNFQLPRGRLSVVVSGDGANTVTTGDLVFDEPLPMRLAPWQFPKAQVRGSVIGFGAVRGLGAWLPDQVFTWADAQTPLQMHFAAVDGRAGEFIKRVESFIPKGNEWLAAHGVGTLGKTPNGSGVILKDLPMIAPYMTTTSDSMITGGLVPDPQSGTNAPPDIYPRPSLDQLLATLESKTNLVAYQWETTGARAESMHVLGQLLRFATRHPQMPAGTASSAWLNAARNRLGNATTLVTLTAPNKLSFERTSSTGFNALELHVLADWMESPAFPRGSYTLLSPVGPAPTPVGK